MKKRALGIVAASAFAIAAIGTPVAAGGVHPPAAGNSDQTLPAAACHGYVISQLAQEYAAGGTVQYLPMGEVNGFIRFICEKVHTPS